MLTNLADDFVDGNRFVFDDTYRFLDDAFCQHYDYQHALKNVDIVRSRHLPWVQYAVKVHNAVQGYMAKFVEAGVISGYEANDYI